jgi:hypothetical protein
MHAVFRMVAITLLGLTITGCAIAGFAATVLKPPEKVPAKYTPTSQPMAVLVESSRLKGNTNNIRDSLASYLALELRRNKVADIIDPYRIYDLRNVDQRAFKAMTIDGVGRKVGAKQVLYVDLREADVVESTGGQLMKGGVTALVKVVDADSGQTLWPDELQDGYLVTLDTPFTTTSTVTTPDSAREDLARATADAIAKLFYSWVVPE